MKHNILLFRFQPNVKQKELGQVPHGIYHLSHCVDIFRKRQF